MTHRAPLVIADYDPEWPARFESARQELLSLLKLPDTRIEHIGSTSVPGLAAKPVIDILLGAASLADFEARIPDLEAAGWEYHPEHEAELPQRRFLAWPQKRPRMFHLHATALEGDFFRRHLRFRDALRTRPDTAAAYAELKHRLAARFVDDREGYTRAKTAFIESVLAA